MANGCGWWLSLLAVVALSLVDGYYGIREPPPILAPIENSERKLEVILLRGEGQRGETGLQLNSRI
jgi:hypothetical protein